MVLADMTVLLANSLSTIVSAILVAVITVYLTKKLNRIEVNGNSKLSDAFTKIDELSAQVEALGGNPSESARPAGGTGLTPAEEKIKAREGPNAPVR